MQPDRIQFYGLSDQGLVRKENEDFWTADSELALFALADGMGGHQGGKVAAQTSIQYLFSLFKNVKSLQRGVWTEQESEEALRFAIEQANWLAYQKAAEEVDLFGMGSTLCLAHFVNDHSLLYAHVGDSRLYRLRDDALEQLTEDHSILKRKTGSGQLEASEQRKYNKQKHLITKAMALAPEVEASISLTEVYERDLYLICTDGLSDLLNRSEIEAEVLKQISLEERAKNLIDQVKERGAPDNVTLLLLQVEE